MINLFKKKKGPATQPSKTERMRIFAVKFHEGCDKADRKKRMSEQLKTWSIYTLIACLGLCLGAGGVWVYKSERTVREVLLEAENLRPKCAYGSQPIIEPRGKDLYTRCANIGESVVGEVIN